MPCSLSFNITYNFGALHFAHCSTAHLSPPSWNSFVFKKKTLNFSASCKICSLLNSAQLLNFARLAVHLFPPSQTWPTRGCPWAGQVNGISPSPRRSPLGNGWAHGGGCLLVVLGVNVVSGNLFIGLTGEICVMFFSLAILFFLSFFFWGGGSMVC